MKFENEARVIFPGKTENIALARLFSTIFFSQKDPTVAELEDIKTAVSEAVTNAIIHGYEEKDGPVEVYCAYDQNKLFIEVIDQGKGIVDIEQARVPLYTSKPTLERSGMGFTIMETFMDQIRIESVPGQGTHILMEKYLMRE